MHRAPSSLVVLLLPVLSATAGFACGGDEPPPKTPDQATTATATRPAPAPPETSTPAPALPAAVEIPAALPAPARVACSLTAANWVQSTLRLRFDASGEAFASVGKVASVKVTVPAGPSSQGYFVEVDAGTVVLKAQAKDADLKLYPSLGTALKGFVAPRPGAALRWTKGEPDSLTFDVELDGSRVVPADKDFAESRPCSFFSLTPKDFDPLKITGNEPRKRAGLKTGKIDLKKELSGGVFATLTADEKSPYAYVLATSGSQKRVAWPVGEALVFGWIPALSAPDQPEPLTAGEWSKPAPPAVLGARDTSVGTWKNAKCTEELPLVAEVDGKRQTVGTIRANKAFQLGPDQNGWRGVAFPTADVLASDHGKLWIPSSKTTTCTM